MEGLRQYILRVTAAAMLGAIGTGLVKKGPAGELVRMLCGLVLALTVLYPLSGLKFGELTLSFLPSEEAGREIAAQGEKITRDALEDIIKSETEAYILDKASALGIDLRAEVLLGEDTIPVPVGVILTGAASPYARGQLTDAIEKDLGIPKENQLWTG